MNRWNCSTPDEFAIWESGFPARAVGTLLLGLIIALSSGCSLLRAPQAMVTAVSSVGQSKPPDPLDLQVQEQRFADDAMTQTAQALDDYADKVGIESARVQALKLKVVLGSMLVNTASGPNPNANLIDLVFGAWVTRKTIEDHWMLAPNGPAFQPWLESSRRLETNAWELAATVLKPVQIDELREAIRQWYAQNPDVQLGLFIQPRDFASLMKTRQAKGAGANSVFSLTGLDPMAGLDPAVREITRTRLFAERALFVLQRMPFLLRLQADLLAHEVVSQPEVQLALTNTTRLSESADRASRAAESVSQTAAQLPDRISAERKEILAALDQQEGKLRDLASEVNRSLVSADKMSASLNITITNFDALMKRFGVGEPSTNAAPDTNSPPFNILDYGQVAQQVGTMAKDLNTLVSSVSQNVPQIERLGQTATGDAQKVVDHAFHLGLVLIAVLLAGLVLAGLAYRIFAERLKRTGRPASGYKPVNGGVPIASRHGPAAGILTVLLITALRNERAVAADVAPPTTVISSNTVSQAGEGPERLKGEVRITVETNAVPAAAATDGVTPEEKSFQWKFTWDGWNGLQTEISQKTPIKDPMAELRTKLEGTNAYRILHLEEVKMGGNIGARLAVDGAAYATSKDFQGFDAGVELRRARVYAKGDCLLLLPVSYEIQLGYVPKQFSLQDTYILFNNLGLLGNLKVGDYQPTMSLDAITSSRDITFMELAAPIQALAPGMDSGAQIGRPVFHERMTWAFGLFSEGVGSDYGDASQNFARAITRLTCLPIYPVDPAQPDSAQLLHLGLSANILYSGNSTVHYRSRPESYQAPYVIDTGDIAAEGALVAGAEAAWVNGPFSVQGEFLNSWVRENNGQTPDFYGLYASASWFLTGESRPYDRTTGAFGRVIPKRNFDFGHGGWGAWEIAGRYSYVNLDSADVNGGRLRTIMAGVNWYLHSHLKWCLEYGFGHVSDRQPSGNLNIFQTRIEADF